MKLIDVFQEILRDVVPPEMALEDVLLRAVVLHTHSIVPRSDVQLEDVKRNGGDRILLSPLTRSHLAALLANLWDAHDKRGSSDFWAAGYARWTPYESFEDIPEEHRDRAKVARDEIAQHPLVGELIADL